MDDTYFYRKFFCITLMLSINQQLFTHSMQKSPFCKANSSAATSEIPCILRNRKVHYHFHRCRPILRILIKLHPVHAPTSHLLKIHLNIILPSTPVSHKVFSAKSCIYLSNPHTCYMPRLSHSSLFYHPKNIG